jgi:hypothetical protein
MRQVAIVLISAVISVLVWIRFYENLSVWGISLVIVSVAQVCVCQGVLSSKKSKMIKRYWGQTIFWISVLQVALIIMTLVSPYIGGLYG